MLFTRVSDRRPRNQCYLHGFLTGGLEIIVIYKGSKSLLFTMAVVGAKLNKNEIRLVVCNVAPFVEVVFCCGAPLKGA